MELENFERKDLYGDPGARRVLRRTGIPRPLPEAGQGDPPALRLRAPRPKPPPHCPRGFQSGARLPQGQKLAPAAPYLGSGQFRRAWSGEFADSGQSTRTSSDGRGRRTKAQREWLRYRKRLRRLHSAAEQAVRAGAQLRRAAGPGWARRGRGLAERLGRRLGSGFINRLEGGGEAALTTHSFPRIFPLIYGPKCGALAVSQVLLSGNAFRELGPSQLQGPGNGCFSPFRETPHSQSPLWKVSEALSEETSGHFFGSESVVPCYQNRATGRKSWGNEANTSPLPNTHEDSSCCVMHFLRMNEKGRRRKQDTLRRLLGRPPQLSDRKSDHKFIT